MQWVTPMAKAGATLFTFHIESTMPGDVRLQTLDTDPMLEWKSGVRTLITAIQQAGMKVGVAIRPSTPIEYLIQALSDTTVDLILIMTVEPGFSGQSFMRHVMPKVSTVRQAFPTTHVQVDGGLAPDTVDEAAKAGANVIVAASAIFGAVDRKWVMDQLRASVDQHA
jgi:ribulose-phosphate 3-epimerase